MASTSSSPNALPPLSSLNSPPPSNSSAPPPPSSQPTSPPQPTVSGSPPASPPASPSLSPPAFPPASPPLPPPAAPASNAPPPVTSSPPLPPPAAPPTISNSPPPETSSLSPPPKSPPTPLGVPPPSPLAVVSSPPPLPPSPPPPPVGAHLPTHSPPTPPPRVVPPSPVNDSSKQSPPMPSLPKEKPIATQPTRNITANGDSVNSAGLRDAGVAVVGSFVGFLALTLMILAAWFVKRRRKNNDIFKINNVQAKPSHFESSNNSDSSFLKPKYSPQLSGNGSINNFGNSSDGGMGSSRSWFTYEELSDATNGFSANNLLGQGGFGSVFKGVLLDGRQVAVKQLKVGGGQGEREFRAEVEIISRIHHRHLVSLVGFCISENQRLLVYDYVSNNDLHYHLHDEGKPVMDWASRVKVAAGASRGLAYLHEDCQPRIIHRDIKSTNILLDNNFEALVADFGLAKLVELDINTHVSTRVMGTFGYLAPEYASSGKLTHKSDVFSFGVVLLELITGRKPVDSSQPLDDESLVEWARPLLVQALETQAFEDLVDPRLENNFVKSEMFRMIEAAAACVRHSASKRPRMNQIARALDSIDDIANLNNGIKPGESGIFDSREHSARIRMFERMAFGNEDYYSSDSLNRSSQSSWRS